MNVGDLNNSYIGKHVKVLHPRFNLSGLLGVVSHSAEEISEQTIMDIEPEISYGQQWTALTVGGVYTGDISSSTPVRIDE